jgi:NAD(P)-dependent dehydrogenase (short-subunit alcohol dehydrogenase family)
MAWTEADVPDLSGRVMIVTGGNGGLGLETSRILAKAGAEVVIAARNAQKAEAALATVRAAAPQAAVSVWPLDLSSLASVRAFTARWLAERGALDVLVNNAGVMALPRTLSAEGYEMQFATNHLGHFALTLGLMPALQARPGARVVTVASAAHWFGTLHLDDPDGAKGYDAWLWYGQSKLCNLLFTAELDRRLRAAKAGVAALAAHPGYAATDLQHVAPRQTGNTLAAVTMKLGNSLVAQSAASGALPTVRAAVDPAAESGQYYGPRVLGWFGAPALASRSAAAKDEAVARALWALSEERTGLSLAVAGA